MFSGLLRRESHNNYDDTDIGCGAKEHHRCPSGMEGDSVIAPPFVSAGSSIRKRLEQHRRPGYLRTESSTIQSTQAGEEGRTACQTNGASGCALLNGHSDVIKFGSCDSVSQQHCSLERDGPEPETYRPKAQSSSSAPRLLSLSHPPLSQEGCCGTNCSSSSSWTTPPINPRLTPGSESCLRQHHPCRSSGSSSSSRDTPFSSSFSFIQQSLNPCLDPDLCPDPYPDPDPELKPLKRCSVHVDPKPLNISSVLNQSSALTSKPIFPSGSVSLSQSGLQSDSLDQSPSTSGSSQSRLGVLELSFGLSVSKLSTPTSVQSQISSISLDQSKNSFIPINQSEIRSIPLSDKDRRLEVLSPWVWQDRHWESVGLGVKLTHSATSDLAETEPDCDLFTLDTEAASSLSVGEDSDAASASSLTSGYESATPTAATKGPAQDHTHDHTHEHTHDHTLDHTHGLAQDHTLDHTHGHTQDYTHDHTHSHTQDHTHDHTHNHTHDHNQDHTHNHTHDHNQDHTHDHTHDWDQGFWDQLVKKYDGILQDCLRDNQTNTKIESKMLKLQRLQQKAIQEDDYDSAERFDKKLEELGRERGSLRLVLPSRLPSIALFLQRLREAVHTSLSRMEDQRGEVEHDGGAEANTTAEDPQQRRERLQQEKHQVEVEIAELQCRLGELQSRNCSLELLIQHEEADLEAEELEGPALRSCSHAQLKVMGRALNDMVTSQNRSRICVSPPASIHRLQEQQQALSLSIKDATAKVVMSQRLAGRLQRKVSETETQLLALHEAKLAAISGNDFSSAKELKAEMGAVYRERERLELLVKRLHSLSSGNSRELGRMKTQHTQLKEELSSRQAQHERNLKENAVKYIELLEERLDSCGCPLLEHVWEADLEACHLLLRGFELCTSSGSGLDPEESPSLAGPVVQPCDHPATKAEAELQECAMLTALGGHWCPEANLQNSEFTKKLGEFLFGMEDVHSEEEFSSETTDLAFGLTNQCEMISDRLVTLEVDLQTAIQSRDHSLTQSLEREVQEVKATLHTMLIQLNNMEEEEEVEDVNNIMNIEEEEDEEEQYFSDSWEI